MKVFLDDERTPPDGWTLVRWPKEAIKILETADVVAISLDHDLGNDAIGTGYDVILWIEEQVAVNNMTPPIIKVHSANTSAKLKMLAGIENIYRLFNSRNAQSTH